MPALKDRDLRKALAARRASMNAEYDHWAPHFRELRDAIQPTRGMFDGDQRSDPSINKRILDSTPRQGLRVLKAGLMAGITSPSRPWFRLGLRGVDADDMDYAAKEWMHVCQVRMYEVMRGSNIYRTLENVYGDLGLHGTACAMILPDFEDVVRGRYMPVGRYRLAEDGEGRVIAMHREIRMPVISIIEMFGEDRVSDDVRKLWKDGKIYEPREICHAVEKRANGDPKALEGARRPWASVYWEKASKSDADLLMISGHKTRPLLAPRWEAIDGQAWAVSSPGMDALGDARSLQVMQREKAEAIQKMHKPPLIGGPLQGMAYFKNVPGGFTAMATQDLAQGGVRPAYEVKPDIQGLLLDIQETQRRVNEAFYRDLFQMTATALDGRSQITAREIAERHEEKLMALGPVLESLDHELLQPLIEATFAHMQEADILPEAPDSIAGMALKVDYISLLAQAQRAIGVGAIERTIGFAGTLAQIKPAALDVLDEDAMMREFADSVGTPPAVLHSPDELKDIRQKAQERAAQAQMMEAAEPMAGAAKLISEANLNGIDALQRGAAL